MPQFETEPALPLQKFYALVEVEVMAEGHREAAERGRALLMSEACPKTLFVIQDGGGPLGCASVDLDD